MKLINQIKNIIYMDRFVSKYKAEEEQRAQRGIALIAAIAFAVMSLLNIKQRSFIMLLTTSISAVCLLIGYLVSKYKENPAFLRTIFYLIFVVVFTCYTLEGGNEGFAALWLITATYAVMLAIDFKAGFVISCYYLAMLLLVFIGPLSSLLGYDYNQTFMLRFPFLYAINFAFATYIVICVRKYQYELLRNQQELEQLSLKDLNTGLNNRNYFIKYQQSFTGEGIKNLVAVYIDVNGLHEVNNREGHDAGDRILRLVADLCKQYFPADFICRMGGDEFLILCENIKENDASAAMHRLSEAVEREGYSISYGVDLQESDFDLTRIVKVADEKMIRSKEEYYRRR